MEQYSVWYHKTKYLTLEFHRLCTYDLQMNHPLLSAKNIEGLVVAYVISGEATLSIDTGRYTAGEGDIFIFNDSEEACILAVLSESFQYRTLVFDPMFISPYGQCGFDAYYLHPFYDRQQLFTHKLSSQRTPCREILTFFRTIEGELAGNDSTRAWRVKSLMLQTLLLIRDYYYSDSMLNPSQASLYNQPNETIENIINYIDENLSQPLSLSMFAEIAHMNPFYFSTYFKRCTTLSPSQYVLQARINRAKKLLVETDRNILDIACRCGFNSTANFNKAFKKVTGKTPSEYRGTSGE
ncbi:helix-turn-helix domain-containing protein [Dysosmobacter sp.]